MGIFCEINFNRTTDDVFVAGKSVNGIIKFAIGEETAFTRITISLKGRGILKLNNPEKKGVREVKEEYINFQNVIERDKEPRPIGSYQVPFNFDLPRTIPPSIEYHKDTLDYQVKCRIFYFIKIKFDRQGLFKFAKRFKREILIISGITPRLPCVPIVWGERKNFLQIFTCANKFVDIKATIQSCVIKRGEKFKLNYEVTNNTNFKIKGVVTKIVEKYTFTTEMGHKQEITEKVKDTDTKTSSIQRGETQNMDIEIFTSKISSIEFSKMISRDYIVRITVKLPLPYRNCVLNIPVQVDNDIENVINVNDEVKMGEPPSYWETMGEDSGDELDDEKKSLSEKF